MSSSVILMLTGLCREISLTPCVNPNHSIQAAKKSSKIHVSHFLQTLCSREPTRLEVCYRLHRLTWGFIGISLAWLANAKYDLKTWVAPN